jgi:CMP-N,N'-diacetyllegionaminic acid synthase
MSKDDRVVALVIGRGNNTLADKNIREVCGRPLVQWAALAAVASRSIGRYFVSSEDSKILAAAEAVGCSPIVRPEELATPTAQSSDAVRHALKTIEADGPVDIVVVIHANVGTILAKDIDACVDLMRSGGDLSAVVPCHPMDEYHPFRAKKQDEEGLLQLFCSFGDQPISANRQQGDRALFLDHSFWVLDAESGIRQSGGQPPWDVMGDRIMPYFSVDRGFDVHDEEDLITTAEWLIKHGIASS